MWIANQGSFTGNTCNAISMASGSRPSGGDLGACGPCSLYGARCSAICAESVRMAWSWVIWLVDVPSVPCVLVDAGHGANPHLELAALRWTNGDTYTDSMYEKQCKARINAKPAACSAVCSSMASTSLQQCKLHVPGQTLHSADACALSNLPTGQERQIISPSAGAYMPCARARVCVYVCV